MKRKGDRISPKPHKTINNDHTKSKSGKQPSKIPLYHHEIKDKNKNNDHSTNLISKSSIHTVHFRLQLLFNTSTDINPLLMI
jgi:hypothetical protein